jgi:hypothetical protein
MPPENDDPIPFDDDPIEVAEDHASSSSGASRIKAFDRAGAHDEKWDRSPNVTGHGAIHVKTFHAKLRTDALEFMDQQINEWLDSHPEYEVKFVTSSVGEFHGKTNEPALVLNVWV